MKDTDSLNTEISLTCESTISFPDVCNIFGFEKITSKSVGYDWYGKITIKKALNYIEQSVYQLVAVAMVYIFLFLFLLITHFCLILNIGQ